MKKGIHPEYNDAVFVMTDGTEIKGKTTKKTDKIVLDIDPLTHPAWDDKKGFHLNANAGQIEKFNKKFAMFGSTNS